MRKIKRLSALFLSVLLIAALITSVSVSAMSIQFDDFKYKVSTDGSYMVEEYYLDDTTMVIPDDCNGHPIVGVTLNAFYQNDRIEYVVFGKNIATIAAMSFAESGLREVTLPASLTELVWGAFQNCPRLTEVYVENGSLTYISEFCFYGCTSLESVMLSESITEIQAKAFGGCPLLSKIYIPSSVTKIAGNAFIDCPELVIYGEAGSYAEQYALENSISFVSAPKADKTALAESIASADELLQDTFGYAPEDLESVNAALGAARSLYRDMTVSQRAVDSAAASLSEAVSAAYRYEVGDVDLDKVISIKDASKIQLFLARLTKLNDFQVSLGDFNGDGKFNITDAAVIQLTLARLI